MDKEGLMNYIKKEFPGVIDNHRKQKLFGWAACEFS